MAEYLADQELSGGGSTLVGDHMCHWPLSEVVHGHKDAAILVVSREGAQDVHTHTLLRALRALSQPLLTVQESHPWP